MNVPVLYVVFNRLNLVKKSFEQIRKAKPSKLFIGADGPRNSLEKIETDKVREYILNNIDWRCEVKTLFRDKNLGCAKAVSEAITWFFKKVEYGIIIEDDCILDQSFFPFCEELLERYNDDERVSSISSLKPYNVGCKNSYDFTNILRLWGWATWSRVWGNIYDKEKEIIHKADVNKYMKEVFSNYIERTIFKKRLKGYLLDNSTTWEFPIIFGIVRSKGLNISPSVNMAKNIGIENQSVNDRYNKIDEDALCSSCERITFPLTHPNKIKENKLMSTKILVEDILRVIKKKVKDE